jgi:DNA-binding MarR family transcriptional regulator
MTCFVSAVFLIPRVENRGSLGRANSISQKAVPTWHNTWTTKITMSAKTQQPLLPRTATSIADITFRLMTASQGNERRAAARLRLTVPEFRVVRAFRRRQQLSMNELLDILGEEDDRLGRIVRCLEGKGDLTRFVQPENRRVISASLTIKGGRLVGGLEDRYARMQKEILQDIPAEIHQPVLTALENLLQAIEQWLSEA